MIAWVGVLGLLCGAGCVWAFSALSGGWLLLGFGGAALLCAASVSGKAERFLFGLLFLLIPVNADFQLHVQTHWLVSTLPKGTPLLTLSAMDIILFILYLLWGIRRVREGLLPKSMWRAGALPLAAFLLWGGLSLINARDAQLSLFLFAGLAKGFLLFFYVVHHIREERDLLLAARCLLAGLALEVLIVFAQYASGGNLGLGALGEPPEQKSLALEMGRVFRPAGTLGHANALGGYLSAVLPLALALAVGPYPGRLRWVSRAAFGLGAAALVLSFSRSAWLAAGLACVVLLAVLYRRLGGRERRGLWAALLLFSVVGSLFGSFITARWSGDDRGSFSSREPQARIALAMIGAHPFLGVGLNNYDLAMPLHETYVDDPRGYHRTFQHDGRMHNVYLLVAAETGLIGLALVLWFLLVSLRLGWKGAWRSSAQAGPILFAAALGLSAKFIHDQAHTGNIASDPFFWIFPALLLSSCAAQERDAL